MERVSRVYPFKSGVLLRRKPHICLDPLLLAAPQPKQHHLFQWGWLFHCGEYWLVTNICASVLIFAIFPMNQGDSTLHFQWIWHCETCSSILVEVGGLIMQNIYRCLGKSIQTQKNVHWKMAQNECCTWTKWFWGNTCCCASAIPANSLAVSQCNSVWDTVSTW